jgi:CRISPR/Cas system-associated endonuclease Cas1
LLCAFIEKTRVISKEMINEVINDLEREISYWPVESSNEHFNKSHKELSKIIRGHEKEKMLDLEIERLKIDFDKFNEELSKGNKGNKTEAILKDIENRIKEIKFLS